MDPHVGFSGVPKERFKPRIQDLSARLCTAVWSRCLEAVGEEGAGQHFPAAPAALMSLCPLAATPTPRLPAQPLTDGSAGDAAAGLRQTGGPPGPRAGLRALRLHMTMEKCLPAAPPAAGAPAARRGKGLRERTLKIAGSPLPHPRGPPPRPRGLSASPGPMAGHSSGLPATGTTQGPGQCSSREDLRAGAPGKTGMHLGPLRKSPRQEAGCCHHPRLNPRHTATLTQPHHSILARPVITLG